MRPGKPVESAYIESFNERLPDECLNVTQFFDGEDTRRKLEAWREDHNHVWTHSPLGGRSPAQMRPPSGELRSSRQGGNSSAPPTEEHEPSERLLATNPKG